MADFRSEINRVENNHRKDELVEILASELGERTTSVNPLTEAMFERIAPEHSPIEYARKSERYSDEMKPVAKNATALKILLHEQVGRPLFDRVLTLKKRDFAECIVAVDAYDNGYERATGKHVPTTLPVVVDEFVCAPIRTLESTPSLRPLVELDSGYQSKVSRWLNHHPTIGQAPYFVYVLDCTPEVGNEEGEMVRNLRSAVHTKLESGIQSSELDPSERAAAALNENHRVYYVGSTNDVKKRIHEHVVGTAVSGVNFTQNFPPKAWVEVYSCTSREEAEQLEGERARNLNGREGSFAYSDEMARL